MIMEFPDWVQVKKIYYTQKLVLLIYNVSELNKKILLNLVIRNKK